MDKQLIREQIKKRYPDGEMKLTMVHHTEQITQFNLQEAAEFGYSLSSSIVKELEREVERLKGILKEADDYLSEPIYENGKPVLYNNIGAGSILHNKFKTYNL